MRKLLWLVLGLALGVGVMGVITWERDHRVAAAEAEKLARWRVEKASLEALLEAARNRPVPPPVVLRAAAPAQPARKRTAQEILTQLHTLRIGRGIDGVARSRRALQLFEELAEAGPTALPAIHGFLARWEEVDYELETGAQSKEADPKAKDKDKGKGKGKTNLLNTEFIVPPSLRFGLFDVVRRIGGELAEQILAEVLAATTRGSEIYYLARVLEETVPGKYRETAVGAARDLLLNPVANPYRGPIDQNDRNYLYAVLELFNDRSVAELAGTQLVQADGSLDYNALRMLKESMKADALPLLKQAMFDGRITEAKEREELFKEALSFAGSDARANELLLRTIAQDDLPMKLREKSIRDLDKHGLESPENLTAGDLQILQARLQLLEAFGPELSEPQLVDAWQRARVELAAHLADPTYKAKKKK